MRLGWPEVLLVLGIVLIVFGAGKLPQVASQLGKGIREFRKAQRGDDEEESKQVAQPGSTKMIAEGAAKSEKSGS